MKMKQRCASSVTPILKASGDDPAAVGVRRREGSLGKVKRIVVTTSTSPQVWDDAKDMERGYGLLSQSPVILLKNDLLLSSCGGMCCYAHYRPPENETAEK
ncbi:hypothetical protein ACOMHN_025364 [Nucella lapillus]